MSRLRGPIFTILALIAACGGKVIVDSNSGGGDQGGGSTGSTSGTVGVGGSDLITTGTGTATGTGTGFAGVYGVGGYYGGAGVSATGGGGFTPCGIANCPLGTQCCNPQCGICVPLGGACPDVSCGAAGATGFAGAFGGVGGSFGCGNPANCQGRIPPSPYCSGESDCLCFSCPCAANTCLDDLGCQQILQCAFKLNCRGLGCYTPQTCKNVIDQFGVGSTSMNLALQVDQCRTSSGCNGKCGGGAVDAGIGCQAAPPMIGGQCTGQIGPDGTCNQQCFDGQMNSWVTKCAGGACSCFFDGKQLCSCISGGGGFGGAPCGGCCPGFPR